MMNVKEMSMELKLSYIRENSEALIEEARHLNLDHREFLMFFLEREVLRRKENGVALGIKACMASKSVLFISIPNLIIELREAMSLNPVSNYKRNFEKYDLVVLDELGYVSFDKDGCEILFNLLSNRNDKGSIIITTNLAFERWEEIFKDTMLMGAIIDRLAIGHIYFSREISYRMEDTIAWLKSTN